MKKMPTYLTHAELLALLDAARRDSTRDWCLLLVIYSHGLRASEACNIQLTDLRSGKLHIDRLKGSLPTVQSVDSCPLDLLDEQLAITEYLKVRKSLSSGQLFLSQKGPMTRYCVWEIIRRHGLTAGIQIEKLHPHVLKHSRGRHMSKAHMTAQEVQAALGHKSINSSMIYARLDDSDADLARSRSMAVVAASFDSGAK